MRKFQIGNGKSANWKSVMRKFQFGNGKSAHWKSVMGNFQIESRKQRLNPSLIPRPSLSQRKRGPGDEAK